MTNVPWRVDGAAIAESLGVEKTIVINDLEAMAYGVTVLDGQELAMLQRGVPQPGGNAAVIAAGTGLGEALLHNVDGRFVPSPSEGGHADFAARTPAELDLVRELTRIFGRVSVEHVLSGPGLVNVYQFTHASFGTAVAGGDLMPARLCEAVGQVRDPGELPARISTAAMERRCRQCVEALDLFAAAYGAEAGNIALRGVATAGVYVGGGIAPKILPALRAGGFLEAFRAKEPMADLVATVPVAVILNPDAGLLGAAVHARQLAL
jgi:glucokinase